MLFIAGYHGSGKTSVAEYLKENCGYIHIERSSVLNTAKGQDEHETPMREWRNKRINKLGKFAIEDLIVNEIRSQYYDISELHSVSKKFVVTGNRSLEEINYTAGKLCDIDPSPPEIIAINVDSAVLFKRFTERSRTDGDRDMSLDSFSSMLQREKNAGIEEIFRNSTYTINNNCSKTKLINSIRRIVLDK